MERNICLILQYDGKAFKGWQKQPGITTVQGVLEKHLKTLLKHNVEIVGSGRTDTNVSALGQVATFKTKSEMDIQTIKKAINSILKTKVVILDIFEVPINFNPRFDAKKKTYVYILNDGDFPDVLFDKQECFVFGKLDEKNMQLAANHLIGTHDFKAFKSSGGSAKSSVRTIFDLKVERKQIFALSKKKRVVITVTGNGFLYNQVRIIAGTLTDVGLGKLTPDDVKTILESKKRQNASQTLKGNGLYLYSVEYDNLKKDKPKNKVEKTKDKKKKQL